MDGTRAGTTRRRMTFLALAAGAALVAAAAALPGAAFGHSQEKTISVAIVKNPQMTDIASLTPSLFTKQSGVKVKYTILDEGKLREITTRDVGSGGKSFDVVMIGMYETPQFGQAGLLKNLTPMAKADAAYKFNDVLPAVRNGLSANGRLYASPFYAESSFLMYRKDVLAKAGVTMPAKPTWNQVATIARKVNSPDMAGICLRGKPGWGDLGASFTTVLNTFGGTWWSAKPDGSVDKAMVDQPEFRKALQFYAGLVKDAGESHAAAANYNQCLAQYLSGKVAMWYDATVAAGLLEAAGSDVRGKNGYAAAPVELTKASGWLWSWALAIPTSSTNTDLAWSYIAWATGPQYIREAGTRTPGGWAAIPPGTRRSTYEIPEYQNAARAFAQPTIDAIEAAPVDNPGTTKRPGNPGVQYVGIPQFQDVGNQCTEQFAAVIASRSSVDAALANCQEIASGVGR